jgi:hypothetical protein
MLIRKKTNPNTSQYIKVMLYIEPEQAEFLRITAFEKKVSASSIVRGALKNYIKRIKKS